MRKFLIATALTALMCGPSLAQGMTNDMGNGDGMNKAGMSSPMNSNARMMKHHKMRHHMMMKKKMMGDGMMNEKKM